MPLAPTEVLPSTSLLTPASPVGVAVTATAGAPASPAAVVAAAFTAAPLAPSLVVAAAAVVAPAAPVSVTAGAASGGTPAAPAAVVAAVVAVAAVAPDEVVATLAESLPVNIGRPGKVLPEVLQPPMRQKNPAMTSGVIDLPFSGFSPAYYPSVGDVYFPFYYQFDGVLGLLIVSDMSEVDGILYYTWRYSYEPVPYEEPTFYWEAPGKPLPLELSMTACPDSDLVWTAFQPDPDNSELPSFQRLLCLTIPLAVLPREVPVAPEAPMGVI
jgi:hypothetical protein